MEIQQKLRSGDPKVDHYISDLEKYVMAFENNNIGKLILAVNDVAGVIADDVIMLKKNGDDDEIDNRLQMLGSKKNKIYQRYRELISDIKHFKTISDIINDLKPKTTSEDKKGAVIEDKSGIEKPVIKRNISDLALHKQAI